MMKYYDKTGEIHTYLPMSILVDTLNYVEILRYIDLINKAQDECLVLKSIHHNKIFDNLDYYKELYKINMPSILIYSLLQKAPNILMMILITKKS